MCERVYNLFAPATHSHAALPRRSPRHMGSPETCCDPPMTHTKTSGIPAAVVCAGVNVRGGCRSGVYRVCGGGPFVFVCIHVCMCICVYACLCMCVCVLDL